MEGSSVDLVSTDAPLGGGNGSNVPPGGLLGGDLSGGAGSSSSEWSEMLDHERVSGCGGRERSEESDLFLLTSGGPSISCEALPLVEELRDSFSLSSILV